jgi:DNA-binding transcriptional MocR family regulator
LKRTLDLTCSPLLQAGLELFLREGSYDRHLKRLVKEVTRRLECAERGIAKYLPEGTTVAPTDGGYNLWLTLPESLDTAALLSDAKRAGVVYAPGELFYADGRRSSSLRLSLAHTPVEEIERGLRALGQVTRAALPKNSARSTAPLESVHV